jgi:hypothetical protein
MYYIRSCDQVRVFDRNFSAPCAHLVQSLFTNDFVTARPGWVGGRIVLFRSAKERRLPWRQRLLGVQSQLVILGSEVAGDGLASSTCLITRTTFRGAKGDFAPRAYPDPSALPPEDFKSYASAVSPRRPRENGGASGIHGPHFRSRSFGYVLPDRERQSVIRTGAELRHPPA